MAAFDGLDFTLAPRAAGVASTQWLRDALRSAITNGAIAPGKQIPSSRCLARTYGLARGTAVTAIDDVRSEGYLRSVRGSGVFVRRSLPNTFLEAPRTPVKTSALSMAKVSLSATSDNTGSYSHFTTLHTNAFRTNLPALDRFPRALWARTVSACLRRITQKEMHPGSRAGYDDLRQALAEYLRSSRGANCRPEQVVIISGVREAIDLTARLLLNPGDRVLVEDPGYQGAHTAFRAARAKLEPMMIDAEGAAPKGDQYHRARLIYLTPGHQFPTGVTMSAARRLDILGRAAKASAYILEDDYDSEFRYKGRPLPVLQGLDRNERVILAGSFNKTMFPALRLGYMVLPTPLVEPLLRLKALGHIQSITDQMAFSEFLRQGHFARHLRQMRKLYVERYRALSHGVDLHLRDYLTLSPIQAGLQTVGWLEEGLNAEVVASAAAKRSLDVVPVSRYSLKLSLPEGIQIGFAGVDSDQMEDAVKKLASAIRETRLAYMPTAVTA